MVHYGGTAPGWIQLQSFTQQGLQHTTDIGSIDSPAESSNPGLLAVGAAACNNTSEIRGLSSRGPTPDGRVKPDIVGADGANSSTLGVWGGTSQASAHVAGLAALVKNRYPAYTPQRVNEYLKTHAESRGEVPNNIWGYGFARLATSDASTPTPVPTPIASPEPTPTPEPILEPEPTDGCVVTLAGSATVEGTWDDSCLSDRPALQGDGERYARFYNFTLNSSAAVTVTLTSEQDTSLYLAAEGVEHENDDESSSNTNSRLEVQPAARYLHDRGHDIQFAHGRRVHTCTGHKRLRDAAAAHAACYYADTGTGTSNAGTSDANPGKRICGREPRHRSCLRAALRRVYRLLGSRR